MKTCKTCKAEFTPLFGEAECFECVEKDVIAWERVEMREMYIFWWPCRHQYMDREHPEGCAECEY